MYGDVVEERWVARYVRFSQALQPTLKAVGAAESVERNSGVRRRLRLPECVILMVNAVWEGRSDERGVWQREGLGRRDEGEWQLEDMRRSVADFLQVEDNKEWPQKESYGQQHMEGRDCEATCEVHQLR